jgi:hypothetical protein
MYTKISKVILVLPKCSRAHLMTNYISVNQNISFMSSKNSTIIIQLSQQNRPNTIERDQLFQSIDKERFQSCCNIFPPTHHLFQGITLSPKVNTIAEEHKYWRSQLWENTINGYYTITEVHCHGARRTYSTYYRYVYIYINKF